MKNMNDNHKVKIGNHLIGSVEMIDKATCLLSFEPESTDDGLVVTQVEHWLDEDKWKFVDNYYDNDDNFTDWTETKRLSEQEINECKEVVIKFLNQLK